VRESDVAAAAEARGRAHKAATNCGALVKDRTQFRNVAPLCRNIATKVRARAPLCNTLLSLTFCLHFN
jgi:hypothetical protein